MCRQQRGNPLLDENPEPAAKTSSQASQSPSYRPESPTYLPTNLVLREFGFMHIAENIPDTEITDWQPVNKPDGWKVFYQK